LKEELGTGLDSMAEGAPRGQHEMSTEEHGGLDREFGWLDPGVLVLREGAVVFEDERARELLGELAGEEGWEVLRPRLEAAGLRWPPREAGASRVRFLTEGAGGRPLAFDFRGDTAGGGVLLVCDGKAMGAAENDLRMVALMRSLTQITPAVAHDLRAPINAMVFNIEVLKETVASGRGAEPPGRERQLRYVNVLKEELHRLHRGMETYIAQISPRGDRDETMDLREPLEELAALLVGPARKQQARVEAHMPSEPVSVHGNRYLLRQALLHLGLAALGTVPRDGTLEVGLDIVVRDEEERALVRLAGVTGSVAGSGPEPAPGFDIEVTDKGTEARLWVARSILASQGAVVRPADSGEGLTAYEIELTLQDTGIQEKE
jgi:signal transduction histidine kinase